MTELEFLKLSKPAKTGYKLLTFFKQLPMKILGGLRGLVMFIVNLFVSLAAEIKDIFMTFRNGDWKTRFSFVIMGFGSAARGQIFRGFLFKMMLKENGVRPAIIVSSVTFGIGHLVNLLAGQTSLESVMQVLFAIAWGFIFTMVFYKCGSLWPNIIVHGLVDVFSKFAADNAAMQWVYVISTIVIAIVYCVHLSRQETAPNHRIP